MTSCPGLSRQELWYRLKNPSLVASKVRDLSLDALSLVSPGPFSKLLRTVRPYTMCGHLRLRGLYRAVCRVVKERIPGDIVECGAARGGSAALMVLTLQRLGAERTVWAFDTFEGLPPPTEADPDRDIAMPWTGTCRGELEEVEALFRRLGIQAYRLVKGVFQETLPVSDVREIAVLHIDCDWHDSVKTCLEHLYDRVSPGGIIQFDDYGHWAGARKAVDEFFQHRDITPAFKSLDYTGRQLVKPSS